MKQSIQPAIAELEKMFKVVNRKLYGNTLPEPAIIIQTSGKRKHDTWNFTKGGNELTFYADILSKETEDIFTCLIHEMVRLYCHETGVHIYKGKYYNKNFAIACAEVGLNCENGGRYGWCKTSLKPQLKKLLKTIKPAPGAFKIFKTRTGGPKSNSGSKLRKWSCPECGTNVRVGVLPENFPGIICCECKVEYILIE